MLGKDDCILESQIEGVLALEMAVIELNVLKDLHWCTRPKK